MMKKFSTEFIEKDLTGNAGIVHFGRFAQKLGLEQILAGHISIVRADNAEYMVSTVILMLIMGVISGVKHISHLEILKSDSVLRKLFNWAAFPVSSTFGRIFRLFSHKHCQELSEAEDAARRKVWGKKTGFFKKITLDMDSSVKGVFGSQEGTAKGYNPKKKGQKSYHPLFCFVAENRECLNNWFRTGSAFSANGCVEFLKECFCRLPVRAGKIFVRADSAFFNGALLDLIEEKEGKYLIKACFRGIGSLLEKQEWHPVQNRPGFECAEFFHKCGGWDTVRRFIAVREITVTKSDEALFPIPRIEYTYFCYVTNMKMTPWGGHKYYGKRATSENWIEWCKNQMASGSILTQHFWANSAIFQTCILAYNLMVWMMWLNSGQGLREEPDTVRMFLIKVPARLRYRGRQWFLRLSKDYPFIDRWRSIEESIMMLEFT